MRFLISLLFFLDFSFAFWPVYYSPSDWLNRSFPKNFIGNAHFSANFAFSEIGFVVSERGALYFNSSKELDPDYQDFTVADSRYPYSDYFYDKYDFKVPDTAFYEVHVINDNYIYGKLFIDDVHFGGGEIGILLSFGKPNTLKEIDNSCLRPLDSIFDYEEGYIYTDGGDNYYNSPFIMNSEDEGCEGSYNGEYVNIELQRGLQVQKFYQTFYKKIHEPCEDNYIFKIDDSVNSVTCVPCQPGEIADSFKNKCVSLIDKESISNPYSYAKAQCFENGGLKYIDSVLGISNGGKGYNCVSICADETTYINYNCPNIIDFSKDNFTPSCIEHHCSFISNENTSSNNIPFHKPSTPSSSGSEISISKDNDNICFDGNSCFKADDNTDVKDNKICINGKCSSINKGSGFSKNNTICIDNNCFHFGHSDERTSIKDNNKLCIGSNCSSIKPSNPVGNGSNNSNSSNPVGNGSNNGNGSNGDNVCKDNNCGSYDGSDFGSYNSFIDSLKSDFLSFSDDLNNQYKSFSNSINDFISVVESGFKSIDFPIQTNTCPLTFDFDYIDGKNEIKIDFCEFTSKLSGVFYVFFYCLFFLFFIRVIWRFSLKFLINL
ncbi:hypothetical protein A0Y68_02000 [Campylobacter lari]|uniref:hypothetical protein n=1 Tax=Campylobacter lari TaxID=201 RepID=UPI0010596CEF|nr:hypothetical protein [Campylobacter lari]EAI4440753.1 hypothetical protein [Campylobacter lari]TDJ89889.1 hypothetical protein E2O22_06370 [Campylobacter lari]HEC1786566.1 hypothetical protein [Campylobacter lari]